MTITSAEAHLKQAQANPLTLTGLMHVEVQNAEGLDVQVCAILVSHKETFAANLDAAQHKASATLLTGHQWLRLCRMPTQRALSETCNEQLDRC